jgi:hypothetical protein
MRAGSNSRRRRPGRSRVSPEGGGSYSQAPFECTFGFLCRVAAGQIHYIQTYLEADQALEAVGLRE